MTITFVLRSRDKRSANWLPAEDAVVVRLYGAGLSAWEIAAQLKDRTADGVKNRMWALRKKGMI